VANAGSNQSTGLGTWRHLGGSRYSSLSKFLLYSTFGPATINGTQVLTREIELNKTADEYTINCEWHIQAIAKIVSGICAGSLCPGPPLRGTPTGPRRRFPGPFRGPLGALWGPERHGPTIQPSLPHGVRLGALARLSARPGEQAPERAGHRSDRYQSIHRQRIDNTNLLQM